MNNLISRTFSTELEITEPLPLAALQSAGGLRYDDNSGQGALQSFGAGFANAFRILHPHPFRVCCALRRRGRVWSNRWST
jgi:hypothetical protein